MKRKSPPRSDVLKTAFERQGLFAGGKIPSAVDALIEERLGPQAAILGRRRKHPSRKSQDPEEQRLAAEASRKHVHARTLAPIAQLLGCEGFTEFCAMGVLHFARTEKLIDGAEIDRCRAAFAEGMRSLTEDSKRKAAGKFVHLQGAAGFEAGLRIGLMASLWTLQLSAERDAANGKAGV